MADEKEDEYERSLNKTIIILSGLPQTEDDRRMVKTIKADLNEYQNLKPKLKAKILAENLLAGLSDEELKDIHLQYDSLFAKRIPYKIKIRQKIEKELSNRKSKVCKSTKTDLKPAGSKEPAMEAKQ